MWICSIKLQKQKQDLLDFLKLMADFNDIFHFSHELTSVHMFPTILQDHYIVCILVQIRTWTLI